MGGSSFRLRFLCWLSLLLCPFVGFVAEFDQVLVLQRWSLIWLVFLRHSRRSRYAFTHFRRVPRLAPSRFSRLFLWCGLLVRVFAVFRLHLRLFRVQRVVYFPKYVIYFVDLAVIWVLSRFRCFLVVKRHFFTIFLVFRAFDRKFGLFEHFSFPAFSSLGMCYQLFVVFRLFLPILFHILAESRFFG